MRVGTVSSYDPVNYCVKVLIQPEGAETGWLPVTSPWIGNGWGFFAPPTPGDMVEIQFQEGHIDAGFVCLRFFNDSERPLTVSSGELWLIHKSGAFFKLLNSGAATFSDGQGATVTLNGDGTITSSAAQWSHTGPVNITGNTTINGTTTLNGPITQGSGTGGTNASLIGPLTVTNNVTGQGTSLHTHIHTDPQGGNTGAPV